MYKSPLCDRDILSSPSTNVVSIHAMLPVPDASISAFDTFRPTLSGGASTLIPATRQSFGFTPARLC